MHSSAGDGRADHNRPLILLLIYVAFALGVSFLCSMLEAALLSVRMATLAERKARGSKGAALLLDLKRHRIDDAISAILVLNTSANTLGATLAGAQAAHVFGSAWIGVFSGFMTLMILVVSEIIPKTLGTVYAGSLSGFVGGSLAFLTRALAPVLVLSRALTRVLTRDRQPTFSRGELAAVIETAVRDGAISREESTLFANLLRFREVRIEHVMTPRTVMFMMPADATIDELLARRESDAFSRIPLFDEHPDNVVGYVLIRDVLKEVGRGCDRTVPLRRFLRRILFVPEMVTLDAGLRQILERREPIAMVTDEHGGMAGLVTLEDLTETILGVEIVDESDRVVDMRLAAVELRDRRLERMRRKRESAGGSSGSVGEGSSPAPPERVEE